MMTKRATPRTRAFFLKIITSLAAIGLLAGCAAADKPSTYKNAASWPPKERSEDQKADPLQTLWPWKDETASAAAPAPAAQVTTAEAGSVPAAATPAIPPSTSQGYFVASVDEVVPVDMQSLPNAMKGILPLTGSYQLKIRKLGGEQVGSFGASHSLFNLNANDLDSLRRFGFVTVTKLQPGDYEIYSYDVRWREGKNNDKAMSTAPFSIPFTIEAGKTTYLGSYGAVGFSKENRWGISEPAGAYFLVTDLSARDMNIARDKMPELGPLVKAIPDVTAMNNPAFKPGTIAAK